MEKKLMQWKVKGMNQDMSASAFSNEFAFENHNLRLSTNENNTLMSWVNERGTLEMKIVDEKIADEENNSLVLQGTPVGTAVINNQLVLFTTENDREDTSSADTPDHIYVLEYKKESGNRVEDTLVCKILYEGNINLSSLHPLETLVSYEADHIKKVYWLDGRNQPRMMNIENPEFFDKKTFADSKGIDTRFDFVPSIDLKENVSIVKNENSSGTFAPGVIQYCITYVNKYQQQSNVVYVSPLYYLSHPDRGASPEEKVVCSFTITITNPDERFDYARLYAIQRTTMSDVPYVRLVEDIEIAGGKTENGVTILEYVDNGTTGSVLDPQELLYVGGREITAKTFAEKDNTLFMGNLQQRNTLLTDVQDYFNDNAANVSFYNDGMKSLTLEISKGIYGHTNTLKRNQREITTFKGGETYRFGFQFQKITGEWSEPIFLGDYTNNLYPDVDILGDKVNLVYAKGTIDIEGIISQASKFDINAYSRIRPVIVFPNINDRNVLCQGVLNPTVFNVEDRKDGYPFVQPSWYFRPFVPSSVSDSQTDTDDERYTESIKVEVSENLDLAEESVMDAYFANRSKQVYILTGEMWDNAGFGPDIISAGKILIENTNTYHSFEGGAIRLSDGSQPGFSKYLFISDNQWEDPNVYSYHRVENPKTLVTDELHSLSFSYYKDMECSEESHIPYYDAPIGAPESYMFRCTDGVYVYTITFRDLSAGSSYVPITSNVGSNVAFKHYDSIKCMDDNDTSETSRDVEIQGSVKMYNTPYDNAPIQVDGVAVDSNTQFFIDQSIVTLNSPDIEMDDELRGYGTDGLKMRIVGAVPITASVSAHSIIISSSMLEKNHTDYTNNVRIQFGAGEANSTIKHNNIDPLATKRLVADYLWNDVLVGIDDTDTISSTDTYNFLVYPWQRTGSLTNDQRGSDSASMLDTKKESTMLYSLNTAYLKSSQFADFTRIEAKAIFTENEGLNYKLKRQKTGSSEINYFGDIDKLLVNRKAYDILFEYTGEKPSSETYVTETTSPVQMRYRSGTHYVVALGADSQDSESSLIPILPFVEMSDELIGGFTPPEGNECNTFWGDPKMKFYHKGGVIDVTDAFGGNKFGCLWLAELYKEPVNRFGGTSKNALRSNVWLPAGDSVDLFDNGNLKGNVTLYWTTGDTYYQRYDCLKTYAYSMDDTNQLVEILSFMCETRVNIDGRYDKQRGQTRNYNMRPDIFNLFNRVYSQQDNFFTGRKLELDEKDNLRYPNQIYFSKTRNLGADVDMYTNITLGSSVDVDGDKGEITSIQRLDDKLIIFQDSGISQLLYNENVQVSTQDGVPIEIANSGKVQGTRYLSDTVGCSNKWSIVNTPSGIYFIDSRNKELYLLGGKFENVSSTQGFNTWMKKKVPSSEILWNPKEFRNIVSYYDKMNHDVMFINSDTCLNFSEKSGTFTSFYDYGDVPYFCNLLDTGIWITRDSKVYRHQMGNYGEFFGETKPYWTTMIANGDGTVDKIFTNLEFTASVDTDGTEVNSNRFDFLLPFDYIESWNDYQHGTLNLSQKNGNDGMRHYLSDFTAALKRKFRLWRCDVPRDNASLTMDEGMNISRIAPHPLNRMRNPWIYFKLQKDAENPQNRMELHNILMTYYV